MDDSELNKFVLKFRNLWKAGHDAHLDIDSHAGQAWVGLKAWLPPLLQVMIDMNKVKKVLGINQVKRLGKKFTVIR